MAEKQKFVFNCQRCGRCCEKRGDIPIYLSDIERWTNEGKIYQISPYLSISSEFGVPSIQMERENGKCKRYDEEKKECQIYDSRPVTCRADPLKYDGKGFKIRDKECPGLNKGEMIKEELEEIKEAAKKEYVEETRMVMILPLLQALLLKDITKKSEEAYSKLTEEEKEKIKEIFEKER
jgi:Fe-S-cluster containining protein